MHYSIEGKNLNWSFDGKNFHSEKKHGLVGDNFTNKEILKNFLEIQPLVKIVIQILVNLSLQIFQPFFADIYGKSKSVAHNGNFTNALKLREL